MEIFKLVTIIQLKSGPIVRSGGWNLSRQKTNKWISFELQQRNDAKTFGARQEKTEARNAGAINPHKETHKNLHFKVKKLSKVSQKKFSSATLRFKWSLDRRSQGFKALKWFKIEENDNVDVRKRWLRNCDMRRVEGYISSVCNNFCPQST